MPQNLADDKSTLIQVIVWCRQATSHYPNPCWPRSPTPYGVTRPQWVKSLRPEQNAFCTRHIQVRFRIWGQISQECVCIVIGNHQSQPFLGHQRVTIEPKWLKIQTFLETLKWSEWFDFQLMVGNQQFQHILSIFGHQKTKIGLKWL